MSLLGNIAVKIELERLLEFLEVVKNQDPEQKLQLLKERMQDDLRAAEGGWL